MEHEVLDEVDSARATTVTENVPQVQSEPVPQHDNSITAMSIDVQEQTTKEQDTTEQDATVQETAEDKPEDQPLTHALEALLGGLEPMKPEEEKTASSKDALPEAFKTGEVAAEPTESTTEDAAKEVDAPMVAQIPGLLTLADSNPTEQPASVQNELTAEQSTAPVEALAGAEGEGGLEGEHPEWEIDSSPIESSSDDSSSDDSSEDESEVGDNAYKLLSVEEQAKILMGEGDDGSDDEGGGKHKGVGGPLRTKNEVPEVVIPKPDVTITPQMRIEELGAVEAIVENILLIKAKTSGEYRVLESGSVLCLEDRSVIGVVAETLGRVQQPLYSVMFTNATELRATGLEVGTKVFYTEQHSTYVFTQALKAYKGSDASNLHDEEVGDEEMEFSDDEAEAEHKRKVKQMRLERRGGKAQNDGPRRGGHPLQQQHQPYDAAQGISYDDADDDGPYKPLARPSGYADSVGRAEAPQEGAYNSQDRSGPNRDNFRGRGRGDRGRGDRGRGRGDRGRGDRGRGRGGYQDRRSDGYSLPPQPPQSFPTPPPSMVFPPFSQSPTTTPNFYMPQNTPQYSPNQPQLGWPQYPPQAPYQQPYQNMQSGWPNTPPVMPPAQNGAFINPAFFPNGQSGSPPLWNQQNSQPGRGTRGK